MKESLELLIERDAPISTWFGVGGRAEALARPNTIDELCGLLRAFKGQPIRVLGDGANLLVDDGGVDGLVLSMDNMADIEWPAAGDSETVLVRAQAGAGLFAMIPESVRRGLGGLEVLAGIPASLGGAISMNAGGAFGQTADIIHSIDTVTRAGKLLTIERRDIDFSYRHSGLGELLIAAATLKLRRVPTDEQPQLRARFKEVMEYKKNSQPMSEQSAGCFFKNPIVDGARVSAGKLIDECGCKGMTVGGASISERHANFVITAPAPHCTARDIIALTDKVVGAVQKKRGITLEREVVIWRRDTPS